MALPSHLPTGLRHDDVRIDADLVHLREVIEGEAESERAPSRTPSNDNRNWMLDRFNRWLRHEAGLR